MARPEVVEAGAVGHGGGVGDHALVPGGHIGQGVGKDFGVGGLAGGRSEAGIGIVGAEAVKLLLPVEGGLEAAAFLSEYVQQHRPVLGFEKLEGFDEEGNVVSVDGAEVLEAELLEEDRGPEHALGGFFSAAGDFEGGFAADFFDDALGRIVQPVVVLVGDDAVEVAGDGADVAVDGPLVVVEDNDHAFGLLGDVVDGFERDSVGKGCVSGDGDDVLFAAGEVSGDGHAEGGGEGGAGVTGAEAVVLALGAQHEAVESAGLADGCHAVQPPGENLVDVGLVTDVENEFVFGGVEDGVQGQGELDDAEVGAEVPAGLGQGLNEELANLLGEFGHLREVQELQIGG
jgi:hypothetical protein